MLKAYIVRIVKKDLGMRTLAIGDGANDVSMIQTADVGVGISGEEGTQAIMASDFAIPRFPMLNQLLLVHGHWCYDRLARMILYFFYKNATFVFLLFWFQVCTQVNILKIYNARLRKNILNIFFLFLTDILWLFRYCSDRPIIFNAI